MLRKIASKFSDEDLTILLEAARIALTNVDTFNKIAEDMDISDTSLEWLLSHIEEIMFQ